MSKGEHLQGQNSLWDSCLVSILKHKNLALAGVFVFFVAGFFAISSLQAYKVEAAVTLVTPVGAEATATTGNMTVNWPSHQAGDIGLLIVETANQAVTVS